jgi:SRSO17 transposase
MGFHAAEDVELRFARYVEKLVSVIGHADRAGPFRDYCTGLVMPGERKKRGAHGGDHGARASHGTASVVAAFCQPRSLAER